MKNNFDLFRRIYFLFLFSVSLYVQLTVYPKLIATMGELGKKPDVNSVVAYLSMGTLLVLGTIPINKPKSIKSDELWIAALIMAGIFLVSLSIILSIILPIYQLTAAL